MRLDMLDAEPDAPKTDQDFSDHQRPN